MNWKILYKYIEGTCSRQELKQLGEWLQQNPANEDFFKTFIEHTNHREPAEFEADAQKAWKQFQNKHRNFSRPDQDTARFVLREIDKNPDPVLNKMEGGTHWYWYAAAIVAITVGLFYFTHKTANKSNNTSEVADRVIRTANGQRTNLILSDGTHITLNADSKLRIPKNYGHPKRMIYLNGEAFFQVTHDAEHPFTVVTAHAYVHDLGTKFNVMTYDTSKTVVAVAEGLVSMGRIKKGIPQKQLANISRNKLGVLKNKGSLIVSEIQNINDYMGWTEGKLVFHNTPFREVVQRLERWYDIKCRIEDPELYKRTLTATYDNMSMNEVLKVLSLSIHVSYHRQNGTILFQNDKKN